MSASLQKGVPVIDETHDPARTSWVASANEHGCFPIQNLPIGIFSAGDAPRGGIAIGDFILDLQALAGSTLIEGYALAAASAACAPQLNAYMALPGTARNALRKAVSALLESQSPHRAGIEPMLVASKEAAMHLPSRIGDYTDFFAGIHHARTAGQMIRASGDVAPNYKYVPIGYHGRASSVRVSGTAVPWPSGQAMHEGDTSSFGPSRKLDYETEVALWIGGADNPLGSPVGIGDAPARLVGIGMLNDWSARDIQRWEAQPLGPFLAKNFMTTISPWIVSVEALAPFFTAQPARPEGDPAPLAYLIDAADQAGGAIMMDVQASLTTVRMRDLGMPPQVLSAASMLDLYWTPAQLIAHHSSNGCDLHAGDLFGTGTISPPPPGPGGALLELTRDGANPVTLPTGEVRAYLQPGDEVTLEGFCRRTGYVTIGTGAASGIAGSPRSAAL